MCLTRLWANSTSQWWGHRTSESEDDEYDILLCEQEDESENCLQDSTVTLDLPNKHVSTCQSTSVETSASLSTCLLTSTSPSTTAKNSESQSSSLLGSVPEAVSLQTTNTELKTKYAVAIAKVIGLTPYLVEFDQLRSKLKQHPELPLKEKKAHDIMLKNLLNTVKTQSWITEETHSRIWNQVFSRSFYTTSAWQHGVPSPIEAV